jgi:anaerobic selenocysteine-containing dehydrogenase
MGFEDEFRYTEEEYVNMLLSSDHPSMRGVTLERLKCEPVKPQASNEVPVFMTNSGRIEFYSEKMAPFNQALPIYKEPVESDGSALAKRYPLSLVYGHSQYLKCSMFTNSPLMRGLAPEPVVEMNPKDATERSIEDGAVVKVFNDRGFVKMRVKVHEGIHPGVVNVTQGWWPENYIEGTHQALTHGLVNPAQSAIWEPNAAYNDILVEVCKEGAQI